ELNVMSPNAIPPQHTSWITLSDRVFPEHVISPGEVANRFLDVQMYRYRPMHSKLSGLKLEYAIVQIYSKDAGKREAEIGFNAGEGTQDIGFRNTISILFDILPSVKVIFNVKDFDGTPAMASFTITDSISRSDGKFSSVYPLPSRRVAAFDEYPDFFFQQQVYRKDGEHIFLPAGKYYVKFTRGPEYIPEIQSISVPANKDSVQFTFNLKRWINTAKLGWFSADHHVHASGCSHYDSPEEGVRSRDMWRQALGEDLHMSAILTWGPSWYYQKKNFSGKDDPISTSGNIVHYDVEVSGFPSSHAGHIVLLGLSEDDFPGTTKIEEWPGWTLPVLKWGKSQGGIVGYAHTGQGMEPLESTNELPNYIVPKMDWNGANEYVMTVVHNMVDFFSAGDTPYQYELNMWYHTLNCGFRTKLSGETDFPCLTDDRIGQGRSYFKSSSNVVTYDSYLDAIKRGQSYVSDGGSHIMDFAVNGLECGTENSEVKIKINEKIKVTCSVAAYLDEHQSAIESEIASTDGKKRPYWHVERARLGKSRKVKLELIANGMPVDSVEIIADGRVTDIEFNYRPSKSVWVALRILGSSHSNPIFVIVDGKQIIEKRSAEWCLATLERTWKLREPNIRPEEKREAIIAYSGARSFYTNLMNSTE
ncbi:MAG: CehA/McbA family metallohydrolase, partial [Ferruginibacter sp.]